MELDFERPLLDLENKIEELTRLNEDPKVQFGTEIAELQRKKEDLSRELYAHLTPWQRVQVARHPLRMNTPKIRH